MGSLRLKRGAGFEPATFWSFTYPGGGVVERQTLVVASSEPGQAAVYCPYPGLPVPPPSRLSAARPFRRYDYAILFRVLPHPQFDTVPNTVMLP